jgi:Rieske 2Fe-2S family protein
MASPNSPLEPTLSREYYFSPEIFAQEKARIFFGQWMCVAREEEVPNPGDYLLLDTLSESIILVRTREGKLAAHYNVCRHRGSQLVLGVDPKPGAGPTSGRLSPRRPHQHLPSGIKCPYHSWTSADRALRTAPFSMKVRISKEQLPSIRWKWMCGAASCL